MARETMAGLVVSCSFLCLVAVVLFCKMNEPDARPGTDTPTGTDVTEAPAPPGPVGPREVQASPAGQSPSAMAAASEGENRPVASAAAVEPARFAWGDDPAAKALAPPPSPPAVTEPAPQAPKPATEPATPTRAPDPPSMTAPSPATPQRPSPESVSAAPAIEEHSAAPPVAGTGDPSTAFVGPMPLSNRGTPPPASGGVASVPTPATQDETPRPVTPSSDPPKPSSPPPSMITQAPPPAPITGTSDAPATAARAALPGREPTTNSNAGNSTSPTPSSGGVKSLLPLPEPPPPAGNGSPRPKPQPAADPERPVVLPPLGSSNTIRNVERTPGATATRSQVVDQGADSKVRLGTPAVSLPPPDQLARAADTSPETSSLASSPARPRPSGGALNPPETKPQIDSYDEETYTCKVNDSFRAISQEFYRTDKYERALMQFNRSHPLATDSVRQDPPILQAGQPVYIPPARILERYYAATNSDSTTPPSAVRAPVQTETLPALRPTPTGPAPPAAAKGTREPVAKEKLYRVRANGEMILEIARRTLGNGDRWPEIYRLNSKLDPKVLIPAGTELRLPSDARVDAADAP